MLEGFSELDLNGKLGVLWGITGIAATVLIIYATVKQLKMQDKIHKRLHLDGDDDTPAA